MKTVAERRRQGSERVSAPERRRPVFRLLSWY